MTSPDVRAGTPPPVGPRLRVPLAGAVFFALLGWGVREAEFSSVGATNNASIWIFYLSAVCFYWFLLRLLTRLRRRKVGRTHPEEARGTFF